MTIIFFLLKYLYRELYPRVLECILQTESSEMILSNKDEILETLNIVATDAGNKHYHVKKKVVRVIWIFKMQSFKKERK